VTAKGNSETKLLSVTCSERHKINELAPAHFR